MGHGVIGEGVHEGEAGRVMGGTSMCGGRGLGGRCLYRETPRRSVKRGTSGGGHGGEPNPVSFGFPRAGQQVAGSASPFPDPSRRVRRGDAPALCSNREKEATGVLAERGASAA